MQKQANRTTRITAVIGVLCLTSSGLVAAGPLTVPNTFSSGQAATAASVNANFGAAETAVSDNDGRITTNTGNIGTNTSNISTNTGNVGTNTGNISTNTGDISTNSSNISDNFSDITANDTDIADHETRITTLEGAGGSAESLADNAVINVDCSSESLQAAIETAPLHGQTRILVSGTCNDDIFIRRGHITIEGATGPGTDSIVGSGSGFSSDAGDSYNLPAGGSALVQRNLAAAVEMDGVANVTLKDITVTANSNTSGVKAVRNSSLTLDNVIIAGGQNGYGVHLSNSDLTTDSATVTGDASGSITVVLAGTALFAERLSAIEIKSNNSFTGGGGEDDGGLFAFSTSIFLTGSNNSFNAGTPVGIDPEPFAIALTDSSSLAQTVLGTGNSITGNFEIDNSNVFLRSGTIASDEIGIYGGNLLLEPENAGDVVVTVTDVEVGVNSSLDIGDEGSPVTFNSGGVNGTLRLLDHSSLLMFSGSLINMDVEMFRASSIDSGENSKIGGNLDVQQFSTFVANDQAAGTTSVAGTVTCGNAEAFEFVDGTGFVNLCP